MDGYQVREGVYQRLEDFCNSQERGNGLCYTSGILTMEEELMAHELGHRVSNCVAAWEIDRWDALMDAHYHEYMEARADL